MFTYFENKEVLSGGLSAPRGALAETVMPDLLDDEADYRQRMEHVFQRYVNWGFHAVGGFAVARLGFGAYTGRD